MPAGASRSAANTSPAGLGASAPTGTGLMLPFLHLPLVGAVSAYAIIRTLYVFVALWFTVRLSERQGIRASTVLGVFALGVPAGILGAHVLDMLEYFGEHG